MELVDTGTCTELELNDIFVMKLQQTNVFKSKVIHISAGGWGEHEGKKEKGKREGKEKQQKTNKQKSTLLVQLADTCC